MIRTAQSWEAARQKDAAWLVEGISPRRLALTLALGFVLGCIPLIGIPTGICLLLALIFRLNLPAIQAANYAAMPFQLALMVPFTRLGGKLTPASARPLDFALLLHMSPQTLMHSSNSLMEQMGVMAGQAMLGWLLLAVPMAALLTFALTGVLRRVPTLAAAEARD